MFCSNSCSDKNIILRNLKENQTLKKSEEDENACSGEIFSELDKSKEVNESMRDLDEQLLFDTEMHKCEYCEKVFISEYCLETHKKQHNVLRVSEHQCSYCTFSAKSNSELLIHLAIHQDRKYERPFKCTKCRKYFEEEVLLHEHENSHANFQLEKCSICDKMYRKGSGLATHMRVHLKNILTSPSHENVKLNSHEIAVKKVNNAGEKRSHCSVCDKSFTSTNSLMRHYIAKHDPNNPNVASTSFEMQKQEEEREETLCKDSYSCKKCGKLFTSMKMLEGHKKIHRNETEDRRFKCPHCKYSTNRSSDMRNHTVVHTREKPHHCSLCGKQFTERGRLRKHVLTHTGEKPFGCDVCGKKFSQRSHLNSHMRTHNKEKPYRCAYCEKTFAYLNVLTRHQRTHTGEKPYICTHCSKSFRSSSALQDHEISQHTHEYPFKCTECGKGFIQFGNMQVHLRNTHNIAIYKLKEVHN